MAPKPRTITAYDVHLQVRYSGESTTAEGWIELDGERRDFRAEASATDRGTVYTIGDKQLWWAEVPWLDSWFEELWVEAAARMGYDLDNEIYFDAHMTSEQEKQE
jgi:hypothetical protein